MDDKGATRVQGTTGAQMRRSHRVLDWQTPAGCLALVGMLLMTSPGVHVARAEDDLTSVGVSTHGPSCSLAAEDIPDLRVTLLISPEKVRERIANSADPDARPPLVLNNSGYQYGDPAVDAEVRALFERGS
jgi:hypothetical protein